MARVSICSFATHDDAKTVRTTLVEQSSKVTRQGPGDIGVVDRSQLSADGRKCFAVVIDTVPQSLNFGVHGSLPLRVRTSSGSGDRRSGSARWPCEMPR